MDNTIKVTSDHLSKLSKELEQILFANNGDQMLEAIKDYAERLEPSYAKVYLKAVAVAGFGGDIESKRNALYGFIVGLDCAFFELNGFHDFPNDCE